MSASASLPSLFLSHGSPMMVLEDSRARRFLAGLGEEIGKPKAILIVSAHWETEALTFGTAQFRATIHDFGGFPQALYDCRYEPPGAPLAAIRAASFLHSAGITVESDPERNLDHGAWVPLMLMYPEADVPVIQMSIQTMQGPAHQLAVGRALAPLRDEGILIVGSGNITHNLREMNRAEPDGAGHDWVVEFADWVDSALAEGRIGDLVDWERTAPHARRSHPSDEHFLPLFTALGAGGQNPAATRIHNSYSYGSLAMDMYAFS